MAAIFNSCSLASSWVSALLARDRVCAFAFHRDGSHGGPNMGKPMGGSWHIEGGELCWMLTGCPEGEELFAVEQRADSLSLMRQGYEALSGPSTPIASVRNKAVR